MSLPSFKLSKKGSTWWADGQLESGRPFHIDCGTSTREAADAIAKERLKTKLRAATGSAARWKKFHAQRAAPAPSSPPPDDEEAERAEWKNAIDDVDKELNEPAPARPSNDELRAKLLHLGDASSGGGEAVEADEIIPPGSEREEESDEEDPPLSNEEGELVADLLATGIMTGLVGLVNYGLKKRKPPQRAEPHEKGLEYFHEGASYNLRKLIGTKATLGPTGKMFVGAGIIVGSMLMNAEPIDPSQAPAPAPEPPHQAAHTNGTNGTATPAATSSPAPAERSLAVRESPLGVFGVEKKAAN